MRRVWRFIGAVFSAIFSSKRNIIIVSAIASVALASSITLAVVKPHNCEKNYELVNTVDSTCAAEGKEIYKCKKCDETKEVPIQKLPHTYEIVSTSSATCTENGTVIFTCKGCLHTYSETIETAQGHSYTVLSEVGATCTDEGNITYQCSRCEDTKEVATQKIAHTYTLDSSSEATCTDDGVEVFKCSYCSDTYKNVTENAKGHDYVYVSETESTCKVKGEKVYSCSRCDDVKKEEKPLSTEHNYNQLYDIKPTCTEDGQTYYQCADCYKTKTVTTPALGHKDVEIERTEPTCTSEGSVTFQCQNPGCTHGYTKTLPVLDHDYALISSTEATCTDDGIDTFKCSDCSDSYETVTEEAKGHDHTFTSKTESTCVSKGEVIYTCSRCADVKKEELPLSTEHNYNLITSNPPTCTEKGIAYYQCADCLVLNTVEASALGHDVIETERSEASCTTDGFVKYACNRTGCTHKYELTLTAIGHDYALISSTKANCTDDGIDTFKCSNCSDTYGNVTEKAKGHDYTLTEEVKVSCILDGKKTYSCSSCEASYTEETGKATGHAYNKVADVPPTCTSRGYEKYVCTNRDCDFSYEIFEDELEHSYSLTSSTKATCTEDGVDTFTCSGCSDTYENVTEKAKGHYHIVFSRQEQSCTKAGEITYSCIWCTDMYKEHTGDPLGHDYKKFSENPAKCEATGYITYQCSRCNVLKNETIPMLGHRIYENSKTDPTCTKDGSVVYKCERNCGYNDETVIPKLNHTPASYATIFSDAICVRCNIILQNKLDNELLINYYYGFASDYISTEIYSQDRTGHDLGSHNYYATPNPLPGSEISFNDSMSLQDFYSHSLLTASAVSTNNGKNYYVDGGFNVSFDFRTLTNELYNKGEMNIQKYSDLFDQFESDAMPLLVKEGKSKDGYYTIYELVDFAHSKIEVAQLVDGKYVTVATVNSPEKWDAVWELDNIVLSDKNGRMFSEAGTYRVMFKFSAAWFIESLDGKIYDASGNECYPYGIVNDQYDYFYVTVTDENYNVLLPDDVDETRDFFYQISLDDINGGAPFVKPGESLDVEDNIDILFDAKIGNWNGVTHYNGQILTSWVMELSIYREEHDAYLVVDNYNLFESLDENGVGRVKISKSDFTGDCKITVYYALTDEATGISMTYADIYYLNIS